MKKREVDEIFPCDFAFCDCLIVVLTLFYSTGLFTTVILPSVVMNLK